MKVYLVGGAVRDQIMGLTVKDRDYVVVGSTSEEMVKLGYKPVGKDFPVFCTQRHIMNMRLLELKEKCRKAIRDLKFTLRRK